MNIVLVEFSDVVGVRSLVIVFNNKGLDRCCELHANGMIPHRTQSFTFELVDRRVVLRKQLKDKSITDFLSAFSIPFTVQ